MRDLLLAETVRLWEDARGTIDCPAADRDARAAGSDLQQRIVARAAALPLAGEVHTALSRLRDATTLALSLGLLLAFAAGAGTAQTVLGGWTAASTTQVNVFLALASLLGAPLLALLGWALLLTLPLTRASAGLLGRAVLALGARLARWLSEGPLAGAAVRANGQLLALPVGRWSLSAASHALWLAFLLGALVALLLLLSTREFVFTWETTILSERSYTALTRLLSAGPALLGFQAPSAAEIALSQRPHALAAEAARAAWAGLLVGCLVVYGALPRALLLLGCILAARRSARHLTLDLGHAGYARLRSRLLPPAAAPVVVDPDRLGAAAGATADDVPSAPAIPADGGPLAVLGLEIDAPRTGWPPPIQPSSCLDLGFVDAADSRRGAIARLRDAQPRPRAAVVVCSLAQSPDRGSRAFVADLQTQSGVAVLILLSEGQRARERADPALVGARIQHWRDLAAAAGIPAPRILELDLDHLTPTSRDRLARWLGTAGDDRPAAPAPALRELFALIVQHARAWTEAPNPGQQAELHRSLARHAGGPDGRWRELLRTRAAAGLAGIGGIGGAEGLRAGATGMLALLPDRLKRSGRWLSAGALAGALGCVAAATLLTPAAIAALPAWAGLGAALAGALSMTTGGNASSAASPSTAEASAPDFGEAIAAAALFALVLHLQGHDERVIGAALERVLDDATVPEMASADAAADWLERLARRCEQLPLAALAADPAPGTAPRWTTA